LDLPLEVVVAYWPTTTGGLIVAEKSEVDRTDKISLVYEGGITDLGKIHLYEYGRALYAFSRLVAVIEYYRRSGHVAQRITKEANVDVIVSAPEHGSFWVDAAIMIAGQVLPQLKDIPFDVFFSFILEILLPKEKATEDRALELARIRLAELKEHTKQSSEETKRMKILADTVKQQALTTRQVLELTEWALKSANTAVGRAEFSRDELSQMNDEYTARRIREEKIEKYEPSLKKVSSDDLRKLTSRARPLVSEIALPLRKSAKRLSFVTDREKRRSLARLDSDQVAALNERNVSGAQIELLVRIKSYDRESGWGKVRVAEGGSIIPFMIPPSVRYELAPKIAQALTAREIKISAHSIMNRSKEITSLILDDVL
jgi:hypothetical protein